MVMAVNPAILSCLATLFVRVMLVDNAAGVVGKRQASLDIPLGLIGKVVRALPVFFVVMKGIWGRMTR
jgi:hypothetical protein